MHFAFSNLKKKFKDRHHHTFAIKTPSARCRFCLNQPALWDSLPKCIDGIVQHCDDIVAFVSWWNDFPKKKKEKEKEKKRKQKRLGCPLVHL
jgi:hypothetical protein